MALERWTGTMSQKKAAEKSNETSGGDKAKFSEVPGLTKRPPTPSRSFWVVKKHLLRAVLQICYRDYAV